MSRNNMDRYGSGEDNSPPGGAEAPITNVTTPTQDGGGTLAFSVPTQHVELPSRGRFYSETHPLHQTDVVEIKYMTAKEEDILTSPSLLKKGLTIDRLLKSLILDKNVNPQSLLSGDRNAIIIAARTTGYGAEYQAKINCPNCFESTDWSVNLDELSTNQGGEEDSEGYNVADNNDGTFSIKLPKSGVTVAVKLLTGKDETDMNTVREKRKKRKLGENFLTEQLKTMIVSVNGSAAYTDIESFVDFVPAFDSKYLRNAYSKVMPNVDMKHDFTCENCDHDGILEVPLTAEFFWPK
jgi:hypothetical protein